MSLKIAFLDSGNAFGNNTEVLPNENIMIQQVPQYEIGSYEFSDFDVIMVPNFADQENLYMHKNVIEKFLSQGKIIAFFGHLFRPWLPGAPLFMPEKIKHFSDYNLYPQENSSIFKGVLTEDMTFKKGVAGFFARGHYHADEKSEVHLIFESGHICSYADRHSTRGTIFVHAGRPLHGYYKDGKTTDRLRPQFIQWLHNEAKALKGESAE